MFLFVEVFFFADIRFPVSLGNSATTNDPNEAVQNLLRSLQGGSYGQQEQQQQSNEQEDDELFTTLPDLLTPAATIPVIEAADTQTIETLLSYLPPSLLQLPPPGSYGTEAEAGAVTLDQKKAVLSKVLRSPQFMQSLSSLTNALREGGLPSICEALKVPVENGGYVRRGGVPVGNGQAIRIFLEGVKKSVQEEGERGDKMETD